MITIIIIIKVLDELIRKHFESKPPRLSFSQGTKQESDAVFPEQAALKMSASGNRWWKE